MSKSFSVVYSKMGELYKDWFETLDEAIEDYKIKVELDKEGVFDDRFVLHIEDNKGEKVDVNI